jgi:hypothetical protein
MIHKLQHKQQNKQENNPKKDFVDNLSELTLCRMLMGVRCRFVEDTDLVVGSVVVVVFRFVDMRIV